MHSPGVHTIDKNFGLRYIFYREISAQQVRRFRVGLLSVFSKNEAKYIQYESSQDSRIDLTALLKLDFSQTLLVYLGIPFLVRTNRAESIFKKDNNFYSQRVAAHFQAVEWYFIDKNSGGMEQINYILIELDPEIIPHSIMDVIFFHELREMYYQRVLNNPRKIAHQKAERDEEIYVNKFLSPTEKRTHRKFSKEFEPIIEKIIPDKVT